MSAYATVEDILAIPLPEVDVTVPHWIINGQPAKLRVRGLGFEREYAIDVASTITSGDRKGQRDALRYALMVFKEVVVNPVFDDAQVKLIENKNPFAIREIAILGQTLCSLTTEQIESFILRDTGLEPVLRPTDQPAPTADPGSALVDTGAGAPPPDDAGANHAPVSNGDSAGAGGCRLADPAGP